MKILIEIGHPAHVHHFKNLIWALNDRGHNIRICTTDKEVTLDLLNYYKFNYCILGNNLGGNLVNKSLLLIRSEIKMLQIALDFKPDIFISRLSPISAHISRILKKPHIAFDDTEHAKLNDFFAVPFTDVICTPSCFLMDINNKQIRYDGYSELAYLHPNYFTPNPTVFTELGLTEDDPFIILRFVSWNAAHDIGHHGIQDKTKLVRELEKYGRVLITSEGDLPAELEKYKIRVSPEKLHDLLWYATLYIGEGATTASECAVLGTHAIYVNTLRLGYTDEEEEKYDLLYSFSEPELMEQGVREKAKQLLETQYLWAEGKRKRIKLLNDKIDVTAFMVWFIENHPKSVTLLKTNPEIQNMFRVDPMPVGDK